MCAEVNEFFKIYVEVLVPQFTRKEVRFPECSILIFFNLLRFVKAVLLGIFAGWH